MWAVIYLCGVLNGELDCVWIREVGKPQTVASCYVTLTTSWLTVYIFKHQNPRFKDYRVVYKHCVRKTYEEEIPA